MLPVSTETLIRELESIKDLAAKWVEKAATGVPGVDTPISGNAGEDERLDVWMVELIGELRLISGKTHNLAEVLAGVMLE